jgi:hypothetical protein
MSSYLTFYAVKGERKFELFSFSRSHPIYQEFWGNLCLSGGEHVLTNNDLDIILTSIREIIDKSEKKISEYEKHASGNQDLIMEIIDLKEFLEETKETYYQILFLNNLLSTVRFGGENAFNKITYILDE